MSPYLPVLPRLLPLWSQQIFPGSKWTEEVYTHKALFDPMSRTKETEYTRLALTKRFTNKWFLIFSTFFALFTLELTILADFRNSMYWFHWNARIGAKMQLFSLHILWIWKLLLVHHEFLGSRKFLGTHFNALNPFSSKSMILTPRGGLWIFSVNIALCAESPTCASE